MSVISLSDHKIWDRVVENTRTGMEIMVDIICDINRGPLWAKLIRLEAYEFELLVTDGSYRELYKVRISKPRPDDNAWTAASKARFINRQNAELKKFIPKPSGSAA